MHAIQYIYFPEQVDTNWLQPERVIVDLLLLIGRNINYSPKDADPNTYRIATSVRPKQRRVFTKKDRTIKHEEYTRTVAYADGRKVHRTLARFEDWQPTLLKSFNLISKFHEQSPQSLEAAIHLYCYTANSLTGKWDTKPSNTAVGLLEIIYNLDLMEDNRFKPMIQTLKGIALKQAKGYPELYNKFHYLVLEYKPLWQDYDELNKTIPLSERKTNNPSSLPEILPKIANWQSQVNKISSLKQQVEENSSYKFAKKNAWNGLTLADVRKHSKHQQQLLVDLRTASHDFKKDIGVNMQITFENAHRQLNLNEHNIEFYTKVIDLVKMLFVSDPLLPNKLKSSQNSLYSLSSDKLIKLFEHTSFSWLIHLDKHPSSFDIIHNWAEKQPEQFYQLLKIMTYQIGKEVYYIKSDEFLFDPNYSLKIKPEQLSNFVNLLDTSLKPSKTVHEILNDPKVIDSISNLLEPFSIEATYQPIKNLTTTNIKFPFIKYRKQQFGKSYQELIQKWLTIALFAMSSVLSIYGDIKNNPNSSIVKFLNSYLGKRNNKFDILEGNLEARSVAEISKTPVFEFGTITYPHQPLTDTLSYFGIVPLKMYVEQSELLFDDPQNIVSLIKPEESALNNYSPNQIAYVINDPNPYIYAPLGWRFTKIYHKDGDKYIPSEDKRYAAVNEANKPSHLIVVVEPIPLLRDPLINNSRITIYDLPKTTLEDQDINFNYERAYELNQKLEKGSELQVIHLNFIQPHLKLRP